MSHDHEVEIARKNAEIADMELQARFSSNDRAFDHAHMEDLRGEIEDLQREVDRLKGLLNSPLHVIAQHHPRFAAAFKHSQKELSNWIVSQKAFKEIAMEYASQIGIDRDEVIRSGMDKKETILLGKSKYENNIPPNTLVEDYAKELLTDFYAERDKKST